MGEDIGIDVDHHLVALGAAPGAVRGGAELDERVGVSVPSGALVLDRRHQRFRGTAPSRTASSSPLIFFAKPIVGGVERTQEDRALLGRKLSVHRERAVILPECDQVAILLALGGLLGGDMPEAADDPLELRRRGVTGYLQQILFRLGFGDLVSALTFE